MTGIRVSLTDRCNFDCDYCHNEGFGDTRGPMAPQGVELTTDEVVHVLEVVAEFGVEKGNSPVANHAPRGFSGNVGLPAERRPR